MRLLRHLNEKPEFPKSKSRDEVIDIITKDCKPFLKEIKGGELLWRGGRTVFKEVEKITPRADRKPLDTEKIVHDHLDKLFLEYHGWKARSEGVFVSPDILATRRFGDPSLFFPIGTYKYLWHTRIHDLTTSLCDNFGLCKGVDKEELEGRDTREGIDEIVSDYKNKGLKKATQEHNEIMFKCKKYYMVHKMYYDSLSELI